MDLTDKTAFITGTGQGIGRSLAEALAAGGCDIVGCDLNEDRQAETREAVEAFGRRYIAISADLSSVAKARAAARTAITQGPLDIVINNAGIATSGPFTESDFSVWEATVAIDLLALMAVTYETLDHLRSRPQARLVNMCSVAGVFAGLGQAAYTAAKFGVSGFTRSIALECADSALKVSAIYPTMVRTRMIDGVKGSRNVPVVEVSDVVNAVLRALRSGEAEVFVPASMRWTMEIAPRLFPDAVKKIALKDESAQSWLAARKGVPDA